MITLVGADDCKAKVVLFIQHDNIIPFFSKTRSLLFFWVFVLYTKVNFWPVDFVTFFVSYHVLLLFSFLVQISDYVILPFSSHLLYEKLNLLRDIPCNYLESIACFL